MNWLLHFFSRWKSASAAADKKAAAAAFHDLTPAQARAIHDLSFAQAKTLATRVLQDPRCFGTGSTQEPLTQGLPLNYTDLFKGHVSYTGHMGELVIDFLGLPGWAPPAMLRGQVIVGWLGEGGYIVCGSTEPTVSILDTNMQEVSGGYPSLYHFVLGYLAEGDPARFAEIMRGP